MPNKTTLEKLHYDLTQKFRTTKLNILQECGYSSESSYYAALKYPDKLSPAHRQVFAKHFGVTVDEIDFNDAKATKNLVA